jgi:hypothetical protein
MCKERSRQVVAPTYLAQGLNVKVKYEMLDEFASQQGPRKVLGRCESYKKEKEVSIGSNDDPLSGCRADR